ncbi:MAG: TonB-dependent receptor plug domain-containing protein [Bacteroidota bacterium]|jgi:vitamin B12 transporter
MNKIFIGLLLCIAINTSAQTDSLSNLEEVVVTANRFPQKQLNTGKVMTVVSSKEIAESPYQSLAEVLNRQVGLSIIGSNNAPGTNMDIYMRGAATGNTLILLNGNPIFDASTIRATFDINFIPLSTIERIEILKGGQSTIYGSDAMAGVINIITKKEFPEKNQSNLELSNASFGTLNGNVQTMGSFNKVRYMAGYQRFQSTGFSSALDTTGKKEFDKDGMKQDAGNIWIGSTLKNDWSWYASGNWSKYNNDLDQSSFQDAKDFTVNNQQLTLNGGITKKMNIGEVHLNYNFNKLNRNYLDDSLFLNGFTTFMESDYKGNGSFAELYGNFKLNKKLTLFTSADHRWQYTDQYYFSRSAFGDYTTALSSDSARISISSLSSSLVYNGDKGLNIELGGRLNLHSMYGTNLTYTFNPSYIYKNQWKFAFNLSSAFKAPTLYQLYDGFSGQPNLKPETSVNSEFAISYLGTKNLLIRAVGFVRNTQNGIDYDYINYKYYNYTSKQEKGVEIETRYQLKKWNAALNYTFVNGALTAQNFIYNPNTWGYDAKGDTTYQFLTRIPRNTLNIHLSYQFNEKLRLAVFHKLVDKRFEPQFMSAPIEMPGFQLTDLHLQYSINKQITIQSGLKNIFNKQYQEVYGYAARGRNYVVGVRVGL